jgi:phosphopantetheinyl transferase
LPNAEALLARLPPVRRARFERRTSGTQRALDLASLRLLEIGMQRAGQARFRLADVVYPMAGKLAGKPHWPENSVDFSIAHTAGLAGCAIASGCCVGFDAEIARSIDPRLVARLLRDDARLLRGLTEHTALARWTQIEAVLKGAGIGVMHGREIEWRDDAVVLHGRRWWIHPVERGDGHVMHVAVDSPFAKLDVQRIESLE